MINEVRTLDAQHSVRLLAGVEATILDSEGRVSIEPDTAQRLDLVLADLGNRTMGVAKDAPDSKTQLIDNIVSAVIGAIRNPVVDVIAHPFNIGRITEGRVYLTDIPDDVYQEVARSFSAHNVCFDVMNLMCHWFPDTPIERLTHDYAKLLSIFADQHVKFMLSSDAHAAGAIGQKRWAERVLQLANVPGNQVLGLRDGPFRFRNGLTL